MTARPLADRLWEARRTGTVIEASAVDRPATIEDAYAVQAHVTALSGYEAVGFKIGSTSIEAQRLLGTDEPGSAPLLKPYVHESPATVGLVAAHHPAVEGEFAFRMARALPPRAEAYGRDEVAAAVGAVAGAIEVVGTRFAGGLAGKGRLLTTADGGVNIALVTGPWCEDWRGLDLAAHPARMHINGRLCGEGTGSRALGHPLAVLVWLVNQQSRLGRALPAGAIVSTGTCTGLDSVTAGDWVVADFASLGTVEITFGTGSAAKL